MKEVRLVELYDLVEHIESRKSIAVIGDGKIEIYKSGDEEPEVVIAIDRKILEKIKEYGTDKWERFNQFIVVVFDMLSYIDALIRDAYNILYPSRNEEGRRSRIKVEFTYKPRTTSKMEIAWEVEE